MDRITFIKEGKELGIEGAELRDYVELRERDARAERAVEREAAREAAEREAAREAAEREAAVAERVAAREAAEREAAAAERAAERAFELERLRLQCEGTTAPPGPRWRVFV